MDKEDYPTELELKAISGWENPQYHELLGLVRSLWRYPTYFRRRRNIYHLSTGGWSGNEDIIRALRENTIFWKLCWVSSRRGGHYKFEVKDSTRLERKIT